MSIRNACLGLIAVFAVVCLCFSAASQAPAHEPAGTKLETPDPSLPEEVRALAGKWSGQWDSHWDALLYVEKVDRDSAQVVFSWGEYNTSRNSCHCGANWVRVEKARVKYSPGRATLAFYTPKLRPRWLKESHTVSGSYDEVFHPDNKNTGRYTYSFVLNTNKPDLMSGDFRSARNSPLSIKLQRVK